MRPASAPKPAQVTPDRQPEAEAGVGPRRGVARLPERLEHVRQERGINTPAGVGDDDVRTIVSADEPNLHATPRGRELHAIRQEVADDLLQAAGVALDGPDAAVDDAREADSAHIGRRAHRLDGGLYEPGEIDRSHLQRELALHDAADVQEVVDQAGLVPRLW